ncbi:MAG: single-stranded-DNA-specific exonuclease RecJ [Thermodesulfobacteriota bacterium]
MIGKRWKVTPQDDELQRRLSRELNISPLTAQLLINRGLVDTDKASAFLSPDLRDLHDPFLMKDMGVAVDRLIWALKQREKVVIYGDYDVDGMTSTSLLLLFFREIGMEVDFYIPERLKEGYGLNYDALKRLAERGAKLIVTTDSGITSSDEVAYARSLNLEVIVTDHHEVGERLPPAVAILNPKQPGCGFPFKGLAGVGVVFNLAMALRSRLREMNFFANGVPNIKRYLDLVAIGTVADVVPLVDENRILVKHGLDEINRGHRKGVEALKRVSGLTNGRVRAGQVGFQLAPRLNAVGRLERADYAVKLLITDDEGEASELANYLNRENSARQVVEQDIRLEALAMVDNGEVNGDRCLKRKGIVLSSEGWHQGVIGIVASRLVERYHHPTVMIAVDGEVGKGSARGIRGMHLLDTLKRCDGLLEQCGGHKGAAGFTIKSENINAFREEFTRILDQTLTDEDMIPELSIDALVSLDELDRRIVSEIENLAPFGPLNAEPILGAMDTNVFRADVVGNNHLKMKVKQKGEAWDAIGFGLGDRHPLEGYGFDIAFSPFFDEWRGSRSLKLRIRDVHGNA